ncbi:GAF domain-containing protein, partial [Chloroflexota bacterium]
MALSPDSEPIVQSSSSVERELVSSLAWLVRLRWLAAFSVLLGTWLATQLLAIQLPATALYLLGLGLLAYNAILWWVLRRLRSAASASRTAYQWLARVQIGMDWLATAVLVYLTGGIESPAIVFFLFHIIISSLLLPHDRAFLYVALAPGFVAGIAILEYREALPHIYLFEPSRYADPTYAVATSVFFAAACYVTAYLSMTISRRLRRREDQLAALYRGARATTSTLDLPQVLDRLAEATAKALGCKAAAIRLLDATGSHLEMKGAYGLSDEYKDKAPIEVARARLDQDALSGTSVLVSHASQEDRLRYPDKIAAEGIHSILFSPLMGKTGPIGVLRAYG